MHRHLDAALRHDWVDLPEAPIEMRISDIATTFFAAAPILEERRLRQEKAEWLRWRKCAANTKKNKSGVSTKIAFAI